MTQLNIPTKEEQIDIYMSLPKEILAEMLYECNKTIENFFKTNDSYKDNLFIDNESTFDNEPV
jgi:hypothetical protein